MIDQFINNNLKPYRKTLLEIRKHSASGLADAGLKAVFQSLRERAKDGESTWTLIPETFSVVFEAIRRTLKITPFDAQMIAACAMADGRIIEFPTGEGKTLVAVFVACLRALSGKGVHVLTFNDYLAGRDALWMNPIYECLGLSVQSIHSGMGRMERKSAYAADITYVTAKEAGFDYLKSFLAYDASEIVQRPFHVAILDEADSILIDEARIPLVAAGDVPSLIEIEKRISAVVSGLQEGIHFKTDENADNIYLTDCGAAFIEDAFDVDNLYDVKNISFLTQVNVMLQAQFLLKKDIDYIVRKNEILIVDEFTGRVMKNRQWPDGLHAAVEIKEGMAPGKQGVVMNSITLQNFLRIYPDICGMTGTACSAAREFHEFYGKTVTVIPPNRPCIRMDHPDLVFVDKEAKYEAISNEIKSLHATGRPVLVGTSSVGESEYLAGVLRESISDIAVLNAKNDSEEAEIVSNAGMLHAVTISTNMAGRGVDIHLGGKNRCDYEKVHALGGLFIIGTTRHESIRIDHQLRGRAGRQGDPGESRFFISMDDDLLVKYHIGDQIRKKYTAAKQNGSVKDPLIGKAVLHAQKIAEGQAFDAKLTLSKYSFLAENQRKTVYQKREELLYGNASLSFFARSDPAAYRGLLERISEKEFLQTQKVIELFAMNKCWADYLYYIDNAMEDVQIVSGVKGDPLAGYNRKLVEGFKDLEKQVQDTIMEIYGSLVIHGGCIDLNGMGIRGPSSTRTYLVHDGTEQRALVNGIPAGIVSAPLFTLYLLIDRFRKHKA